MKNASGRLGRLPVSQYIETGQRANGLAKR
jgi:hypothetical protein